MKKLFIAMLVVVAVVTFADEYTKKAASIMGEEFTLDRYFAATNKLYIEAEDFMEEPPKKYFRMFPGNEVRLMNAYFVTCTGVDKDADGNITAIHADYDPETRGGDSPDGRKVKGTIHWVNAPTAGDCMVRLYENIVNEDGRYNEDGSLNLNPNSLTVLQNCKLEKSLEGSQAYDSFQFVRNGYFCCDCKDSRPDHLVFNRIVSLKSSWKPGKK